MDTELSQGLTFLAWSSGVFLIVIGLFTAKLLFDLSRLANSTRKTTDILHKELAPIMKNVAETTTTINNLVQSTNKKMDKLSDIYDKATDIVINVVTTTSSALGLVFKEGGKLLFSALKSMIKQK